MISSLPEVEKRIIEVDNKISHIKYYDEDNLYPQNMIDIVNASGTTKSCVNLYAKFMRGGGFKDASFYKAQINANGLTPDKLLRKITKKYAYIHGFAIHVNYNAMLQICEVNYIPFDYCRLGIGEKAGKIAVYDNWAGRKGKFDKDKIEYIDKFNNDPAVLNAQINGDITTYKGQVFWYSENDTDYPLAPYDAVIEDVCADSGIKTFRMQSVENAFNASAVVEYGYKFKDEQEREDEVNNWAGFMGPKNSAKIIVLENENGNGDDKSIRITKLDAANNDKMYQVTNQTVKDSIIQAFTQPPRLLGVQVPGKLGGAQDIHDDYLFYNSVTADERLLLEETFKTIFSNFYIKINPTEDYSISELRFYVGTTEKPSLINQLGYESVNLLVSILEQKTETKIPDIQKINLLQRAFGLTLEEAQSFVLPIAKNDLIN